MLNCLSGAMTGLTRFVKREFVAAWPVFLFFLTGLFLLLVLIELALAQFSIEITALSNSVVGALFAAKTTLVLDETPLARSLQQYRPIIAIMVKTFFYGALGLLFGYLERLLEALHKVHDITAAVGYVIDHSSHYRLLAWSLGIAIVFALYFTFLEIGERMGRGALWKLFFETPGNANDSNPR